MRMSRYGLTLDLPQGWEGRMYRRATDEAEETSNPVVHAGSFALPDNRGDWGSGAVDLMGPDDAFLSLFEYDPEAASTPLFKRSRPALSSTAFKTSQLQRALPGQSGAQFFFSEAGRAFCLYVVLGSHSRRAISTKQVHQVLRGLRIGRRTG